MSAVMRVPGASEFSENATVAVGLCVYKVWIRCMLGVDEGCVV